MIIIIKFFKEKYNIECTFHSTNIIYIKTSSASIFKELIKPYVIESMNYKL